MSLFAIADLHLSGQVNKSMEVFGDRWQDYKNRLETNWRAVVTDKDTVVIPGDISWGMNLEESLEDFLFLDSLPGKKIIGKGNHDFWWTTVKSMKRFFETHGITTIDFLLNNAFVCDGCIVTGTRGWFYDKSNQKTVGEVDYHKIVAREQGRLTAGIRAAKQLKSSVPEYAEYPIYVFLHFPPVFGDFKCEEILSVLESEHITDCYYGHIHGNYDVPSVHQYREIRFTIIAADYLKFLPRKIT